MSETDAGMTGTGEGSVSPVWGWLAGAGFLLAGVLGPVGWSFVELSAGEPSWHAAVIVGVLLPSAVVGAGLAARLPGDPVGWLLLASTAGAAVGSVAGHWAEYHPTSPGSVWTGWLGAVLWGVGAPLLPLIALVFPDGHPVGRLGRLGVRAGTLGLALLTLGSAMMPGRLSDQSSTPEPVNPLGVGWLRVVRPGLLVTVVALLLVATVLAGVTLVGRWRCGSGLQRLALTAGGAPLVAALGLAVAAHVVGLGGAPVAVAAGLLAAIAVPCGIWLAVTRYRLYSVDLLIARTLGYLLLTIALALLFGVTAALMGLAAGRGSPAAAAVAAAVIATVLSPARTRLLMAAERSVLGPAGDPDRAASRIATHLATLADPDRIPIEAAAAVGEALNIRGVVLVLPPETLPAASSDADPPGGRGRRADLSWPGHPCTVTGVAVRERSGRCSLARGCSQ
jgi:hypothetical protein